MPLLKGHCHALKLLTGCGSCEKGRGYDVWWVQLDYFIHTHTHTHTQLAGSFEETAAAPAVRDDGVCVTTSLAKDLNCDAEPAEAVRRVCVCAAN